MHQAIKRELKSTVFAEAEENEQIAGKSAGYKLKSLSPTVFQLLSLSTKFSSVNFEMKPIKQSSLVCEF